MDGWSVQEYSTPLTKAVTATVRCNPGERWRWCLFSKTGAVIMSSDDKERLPEARFFDFEFEAAASAVRWAINNLSVSADTEKALL